MDLHRIPDNEPGKLRREETSMPASLAGKRSRVPSTARGLATRPVNIALHRAGHAVDDGTVDLLIPEHPATRSCGPFQIGARPCSFWNVFDRLPSRVGIPPGK